MLSKKGEKGWGCVIVNLLIQTYCSLVKAFKLLEQIIETDKIIGFATAILNSKMHWRGVAKVHQILHTCRHTIWGPVCQFCKYCLFYLSSNSKNSSYGANS